jgi:hypothetical protein
MKSFAPRLLPIGALTLIFLIAVGVTATFYLFGDTETRAVQVQETAVWLEPEGVPENSSSSSSVFEGEFGPI